MKPTTSALTIFVIGAGAFASLHLISTQADDAGGAAFFNDVEHQAYYNAPAAAMARKGIVKGYDDGRFGPNDPVTRGQVVTMLHRYDQSVVQPLREQIAKLRDMMNLGRCGDGQKQIGEQCDDGNVVSGDGCSAECLKEFKPKPVPVAKKKCVIGGCSGQLCGEEGDDLTSTCEFHDEYRCFKKSVCERQANGQCDWTLTQEYKECIEDIFPGAGCPEDVKICPDGSDVVRNAALNCEFNPCPSGSQSCEDREQKLADLIRSKRACRTDDDCSVLVRACGPFMTCGKPVSTGALGDVKIAIADYIRACPGEEATLNNPGSCVGCAPRSAVCERGFCMLNPPDMPECGNGICEEGEVDECEEIGDCPDGEQCVTGECKVGSCPQDCVAPAKRCEIYRRGDSEEDVCAICGDSRCDAYEECTSSDCTNMGCTDDCGPLYCPADCE